MVNTMWLAETVPSKAILFQARGVEGGSVTNRNSGKNSTFSVIALDPDNRFRFPPVSLFFDICSTFIFGRGVWENLFWVEFAGVKVGSRAQILHGPEMLNMEHFAWT